MVTTDFYHNPHCWEVLPSISVNRVVGSTKTCWSIMIGFCTIHYDITIEYGND